MAFRLPRSGRGWALTILALVVCWYITAYPRGMLAAYFDHARGYYEVKSGGLQSPCHEEYARLLEEKYGVTQGWGGDCMPQADFLWFVQGYNEVSVRLLTARYGSDIFEECRRQALQQAGCPPE